eukprot:scaffold27437_cov96-Isochrysis_galbana.AAC.3
MSRSPSRNPARRTSSRSATGSAHMNFQAAASVDVHHELLVELERRRVVERRQPVPKRQQLHQPHCRQLARQPQRPRCVGRAGCPLAGREQAGHGGLVLDGVHARLTVAHHLLARLVHLARQRG